MSRRLSGRISPLRATWPPSPPRSLGSWPDIFPRENIDTVHRMQADFEKSSREQEREREREREREKERENEGRKRTDAAASKRFDRAGRRSTRRHWRTEFNYTAGMTDTLMGGRGSSSNFGNTFLAFLFPRPLDRGLRSLTRWRVMMGYFAWNETWRSAKRMLDANITCESRTCLRAR